MSSRLIIALIIMLLAPGVQAHNFVTGKTTFSKFWEILVLSEFLNRSGAFFGFIRYGVIVPRPFPGV